MRLSQGTEWALHACTVLAMAGPERAVPVAALGRLYTLAPASLAKHLQALAAAGVLDTTAGRAGGYRLGRPAEEITMGDVVAALDGDGTFFRCTEIRTRGPVGGQDPPAAAPCGIASAMWAAESTYRDALAQTSIADLLATIPPQRREAIQGWLAEG